MLEHACCGMECDSPDERKHDACRADMGGCSGDTYISRVKSPQDVRCLEIAVRHKQVLVHSGTRQTDSWPAL